MRSQGQVRFITISSRMQIAAASLAIAVIGGWGVSMGVMAFSQYRAESARLSLLEREAEVAKSERRVTAYRDDIDQVAGDIARRMEFLEEATAMLPDDILAEDTVSDSTDEAAKTVAKISAVMPEAASLARLEAHGGAGGDVEPHAAGLLAVEAERRVGFEEMVVRTDLDRAVAGIGDFEGDLCGASVELDVAWFGDDFAGDQFHFPFLMYGRITVPSPSTPKPIHQSFSSRSTHSDHSVPIWETLRGRPDRFGQMLTKC